MFKNLLSYFWHSKNDLSLEDVYEILETETFGKNTIEDHVNEEIADYTCYYRTGSVTSANKNEITIDNLYHYSSANLNIAVGTKVSFICYTEKNTVYVSNVTIVDDEWNCFETSKSSKWCQRSLIGQVIKREGRNIFVDPGDVVVNLNSVNSEFIPVAGDWIELDVISEIDEGVTDLSGKVLNIRKISPLRYKVLEGTVKTWNVGLQSGTINFNIFFNRESLCAGYVPSLKDKVIAEIVESEQGRCSWRALKVLSKSNDKVNRVLNTFESQYDVDNSIVNVSEDITLEFSQINECLHFEFELTNLSKCDIFLNDIIIENLSNQCRIAEDLPMCIKTNETVKVHGECTVKTAGFSKEIIIFSFDVCKIGRWINMSVKISNKYTSDHVRYDRQKLMLNTRKFMQDKDQIIVKGPKPFVPARFVPYRLPDYQVPTKLWDVFLNFDDGKRMAIDELKTVKPVLNVILSFQNYEERFHTLLHLEEINSVVEMRKFDRDRACFIRNCEYLMLEYESLAEQRPSIVTGDTVLAKDTMSNHKTCLEGYVYKVGSKHVYLKFNQKFHEEYKGDDYTVAVVQSRTQMRRIHQAVGLAVKNLGRKFLFPTQVVISEPQISFVYDNYEDVPLVQKSSRNNIKKLSNSEIMKIILGNKENPGGNSNNAVEQSENITQKSKLNLPNGNYKIPKKILNKSTLKLEWFDKSLNFYQKEAVRHILLGEARPLPYFIFGPPGTGKTITLVETILQILRMAPSRILVAAPSNSAANLICIRLINSGVLRPGDLVRIVSYKSINDNSIPAILAPYCATASIGVDGTGSNNTFVTENGLTIGCNSKILGKHRITIGTCTGLGVLYSLAFAKGQFSHIIVDEAGQATEPEIMIPLSFLDILTGQCILAGDPMQLGPVVCSKYASEFGLCESFMERLLNRFPFVRDIEGFTKSGGYDPKLITKLIYNYRSLPGVLELPNSMFYFSELKPTISAENSAHAKLLMKFKEFLPKGNQGILPSFVFHGVDGENFQVSDSPSWYNPHEISQVFYYVNEMYRAECTAADIGIITPYSKQTKEMKNIFMEAEFDVPKVGTVEEFQGQEFNVIILSTVRSNKNILAHDKLHNLGFITQPKRLNVALTRAQVLTIVVGNPFLLVNDSSWKHIIQYAVKNGCYCGCNIPESFYND